MNTWDFVSSLIFFFLLPFATAFVCFCLRLFLLIRADFIEFHMCPRLMCTSSGKNRKAEKNWMNRKRLNGKIEKKNDENFWCFFRYIEILALDKRQPIRRGRRQQGVWRKRIDNHWKKVFENNTRIHRTKANRNSYPKHTQTHTKNVLQRIQVRGKRKPLTRVL